MTPDPESDAEQHAPGRGAPLARLPKGRHGLSRAFVISNQRERILDATAHVIAANGYAATRVADITDYAGVSRRTFYELFTDKEDCFLAAFDTFQTMLMARIAEALESKGPRDWETRTRIVIGEVLRFLASEPAFARLSVVEALGAGPKGLARRDGAIQALLPIVDLQRDQPVRSGLSEHTAAFVMGGILEIVYATIRAGRTTELPALEQDIARLAFRAYVSLGEGGAGVEGHLSGD
jgi:AcrR family transcriptional regulator